jgi:hypothetical protein
MPGSASIPAANGRIFTPREIVSELDRYIIAARTCPPNSETRSPRRTSS